MKFQLGDKVLVLHSGEEGEIVDLINKEMVLLDVDGVRFPVYIDQIDYPYFKRFTEKKIVPSKPEKVYIENIRKEKVIERNQVASGVWLSFLPVFDKDVFEEDIILKFKLYLLNQTADVLSCNYTLLLAGRPDHHHQHTIFPFSDFYLHDISFEAMNDAPKFEFDFALQPPDKNKELHFETFLKIKGKPLFKKIEEMKLKNEPAFSYRLFEYYPEREIQVVPEYQQKIKSYDIGRVREKLEPARSVIDLHIEKLVDNGRNMSNFEILTLQLNYFEKYYQLAVAHRQPNLIVVHGVGTGKLRDEIHEILKLKREVKSFANQYHPGFGFGATEIFFQYD